MKDKATIQYLIDRNLESIKKLTHDKNGEIVERTIYNPFYKKPPLAYEITVERNDGNEVSETEKFHALRNWCKEYRAKRQDEKQKSEAIDHGTMSP